MAAFPPPTNKYPDKAEITTKKERRNLVNWIKGLIRFNAIFSACKITKFNVHFYQALNIHLFFLLWFIIPNFV
jgi:hypothetical protein